MTPEEFKIIWTKNGDATSPINPIQLKELKLTKNTVDFLTISGLPEEASPFLTFVKESGDEYETITLLTEQYDFLESEFDKFIVIGSDGNGDVITVNTKKNDQIEWLDHEDYFSSRFMNSSIIHLADFLKIYRDFNEIILTENGEDAVMDCNFTDEQFEILKQKMMKADPKAIENGFWNGELEMLLGNREYYRNEN